MTTKGNYRVYIYIRLGNFDQKLIAHRNTKIYHRLSTPILSNKHPHPNLLKFLLLHNHIQALLTPLSPHTRTIDITIIFDPQSDATNFDGVRDIS